MVPSVVNGFKEKIVLELTDCLRLRLKLTTHILTTVWEQETRKADHSKQAVTRSTHRRNPLIFVASYVTTLYQLNELFQCLMQQNETSCESGCNASIYKVLIMCCHGWLIVGVINVAVSTTEVEFYEKIIFSEGSICVYKVAMANYKMPFQHLTVESEKLPKNLKTNYTITVRVCNRLPSKWWLFYRYFRSSLFIHSVRLHLVC
jgi:hypothetical protein